MIYSVSFMDLTESLNPLSVCKYLEQTNWTLFELKNNKKDVKVFQYIKENEFYQVIVPISKSLSDYKQVMYDVVKTIAHIENKSVEQVMLFLLNPNADIIKIRLDKKNIKSGSIMLDDAIRLFENTKKLIAATALDIVNPKKIHYGRMEDSVQQFLNQCRFGQTEIGSYIVPVVCPFAELSEEGYQQLSIFSDEDRCANSLTRKVTNKLLNNITKIKQQIDAGLEDSLLYDESGISANFFEALNGIYLQSENTLVEFTAEWSPIVKKNRSQNNNVQVTTDYYQPISSVIDKIKEKTKQNTEIVGRIKKLSAAPVIDERNSGTITIEYVLQSRIKSVTVTLSKEDYSCALEAHQDGKYVRVVGELCGTSGTQMDNALFSIVE